MTARYRPATDDERAGLVRSQWLWRAMPRAKERPHRGFALGRPGHFVEIGLVRRAVEGLVDSLLAEAEVLVMEVETSAGPEILGWAAYSPDEGVFFVCVQSGYGKRGVGTALLRRVRQERPDAPALWSTPPGRKLLAAAARSP